MCSRTNDAALMDAAAAELYVRRPPRRHTLTLFGAKHGE